METYKRWLESCLQCGIPAISTDTAARLMAVLYEYGNNEGFTYNLGSTRKPGKGIAKRLMEQAERITREAGITHLHIRTWPNEAEEWTRQWYKRLGFRPIGVHKNDMSVEWRKELK